MERPEPLTPLDESWDRALCVVAHPDDLEFGAAAAVARWTGQGKSVVYAMVTSGEAGIDGLEPDKCRVVREEEQRRIKLPPSAKRVDPNPGNGKFTAEENQALEWLSDDDA